MAPLLWNDDAFHNSLSKTCAILRVWHFKKKSIRPQGICCWDNRFPPGLGKSCFHARVSSPQMWPTVVSTGWILSCTSSPAWTSTALTAERTSPRQTRWDIPTLWLFLRFVQSCIDLLPCFMMQQLEMDLKLRAADREIIQTPHRHMSAPQFYEKLLLKESEWNHCYISVYLMGVWNPPHVFANSSRSAALKPLPTIFSESQTGTFCLSALANCCLPNLPFVPVAAGLKSRKTLIPLWLSSQEKLILLKPDTGFHSGVCWICASTK